MATPTFRWGWREEENLVNSHAAARRLGGNWIAYGDEESKFLESCYKMDPTHRGTSATTLMVKSKQFRPETGSMYRFDFVEMVQINAQTGHRQGPAIRTYVQTRTPPCVLLRSLQHARLHTWAVVGG